MRHWQISREVHEAWRPRAAGWGVIHVLENGGSLATFSEEHGKILKRDIHPDELLTLLYTYFRRKTVHLTSIKFILITRHGYYSRLDG